MTAPAHKERPSLSQLIGLVVFFVACTFLRLYFLSSHGSWDTEYWKAWASEAANAGIAHVYGGPESVPRGEFFDQLRGIKPRSEVSFRGRDYPIDYPPLGLAAWGASWRFFTAKPRPYRGAEAENLAVKFPGVLGDLLAVLVLLRAFRGDPRRGLALAAVYWIFPVTWVSSAILGFFDGFVAPFLLASLLLAPAAPFLAGVLFAITCLIKPTAAIALPGLFLATKKPDWAKVVAGGALGTACVLVPYLLAGTLETAIVHVGRIFTQDRLSGGYANPWWIFGHIASITRGKAEWADPIDYVRRDSFDLPFGLVGFVAAALVAVWILVRSRQVQKLSSVVYVSALLLFMWGVLTVGVHDNHNHPLFVLLVATGLGTVFLRRFSFAVALTTLLGSVCLHGLGRYYGPQWRPVLPVADAVARLRMAFGFDLTLLLSVANCLLLAFALVRLKRTLEELEAEG